LPPGSDCWHVKITLCLGLNCPTAGLDRAVESPKVLKPALSSGCRNGENRQLEIPETEVVVSSLLVARLDPNSPVFGLHSFHLQIGYGSVKKPKN
jgi:hypothetical protein